MDWKQKVKTWLIPVLEWIEAVAEFIVLLDILD